MRQVLFHSVLLTFVLFLSSCATFSRGDMHGLATWYGRDFQGRKTASGERFDRRALTAAHRTLPFGTKVRVTRKDTGQSVEVRINDRGPYAHDAIIDLSWAAARDLDLLRIGRAEVSLDRL